MVFGRADERDGEEVERRSAVIFRFGEDLREETNYFKDSETNKSTNVATISRITHRCRQEFRKQHCVNLMSVSWAGENRHDSSSSEMKSMAPF